MYGDARLEIEAQPRYRDVHPDLWPVRVAPNPDELFSSWVQRLGMSNGLSPRHFGDVLGFGAGMWSPRLDLDLPQFVAPLLVDHTGLAPSVLVKMQIDDAWRSLLLPLRHAAKARGPTWLQFCPACLASDEAPYFRRYWRLATQIYCRVHQSRLLDRCPSCEQGVAAFEQRSLIPQHCCANCGLDFRSIKPRRLDPTALFVGRCVDDICRLERAKGSLATSSLAGALLSLPRASPRPMRHALTNLSLGARIRCFSLVRDRLAEILGRESPPEIAFWRQRIIRSGGLTETLKAALRATGASGHS